MVHSWAEQLFFYGGDNVKSYSSEIRTDWPFVIRNIPEEQEQTIMFPYAQLQIEINWIRKRKIPRIWEIKSFQLKSLADNVNNCLIRPVRRIRVWNKSQMDLSLIIGRKKYLFFITDAFTFTFTYTPFFLSIIIFIHF